MIEKLLELIVCLIWVFGGAIFVRDAILDFQKKRYYFVGMDIMMAICISVMSTIALLDIMEVI